MGVIYLYSDMHAKIGDGYEVFLEPLRNERTVFVPFICKKRFINLIENA